MTERRGLLARTAGVVVALVLLGYGAALLGDLWVHPEKYQWDFVSYYYAGRAADEGLNPYALDSLSRVAGAEIGLPFAYSPATLPLFQALSRLELVTAYRVYLGLKIIAVAGLLCLWSFVFLREERDLLFYVVCLLGFGGAIYLDLEAGNVSILEQVGLWLAFWAWRRSRWLIFAGLILLVSLFKVTPLVFLVLLLVRPNRRRVGVFVGALFVFLAISLITYVLSPLHVESFLSVAGSLDDRGAVNPSTLALVRDVSEALGRKGLTLGEGVEVAVYLAVAVAVAVVTLFTIRRSQGIDDRVGLFVICLAYALVMPRFKNYAYVLLIPPAYYVIRRMLTLEPYQLAAVLLVLSGSFPVPFGLAGAFRNLFWGYYPWLMALALWSVAVLGVFRMTKSRMPPAVIAGAGNPGR